MHYTQRLVKMTMKNVVFQLSATYDQKMCFSQVIHQRNSANVRSTGIYFSSQKQCHATTKVPGGKRYYATHPPTVHAGITKLQESFGKVKEHQNVKRIQPSEFQKDLLHKAVRVLQIDYAMAYQCELQKETMGALWTRGSVNLFTCTIYHKSEIKTMMFCTNYKGKDKFSISLFFNMSYKDYIPSNKHVSTKVIWSDGPSSEFKNQYMHFLIQELSKKHGKPFIWKFSATSHSKGVVDGVVEKSNQVFTRK